MIRIFTVFSLLYKIPLTDRQWMAHDISSFCTAGETCPYCTAGGCLEGFGHYGRYLIGIESGEPSVHTVRIKRYRCISCRHTHALLSSCLVPYRSYSLRFILTVLYHYFCKRGTVEQICRRFCIQPSTLYEWKSLFMRQKEVWLGVLDSLYKSESSCLLELTGRDLKGFYERFRTSFLECFPRTDREVLFLTGRKKRGIT